MRIISKRTLREFWNLYPDVENQLLVWYKVMECGSFFHSNDILESFPYSRSSGSGRYVVINTVNSFTNIPVDGTAFAVPGVGGATQEQRKNTKLP